MKLINPEKCIIFFDFDNTIATCDVFDSMLPRFSKNDLWMELEKEWQGGRIGSRACLQGQIKGMGINKKALDRYLAGIKIDPYFKKIGRYLISRKIKIVVLSDNFDYILERILDYHAIKGLKVYSNKLRFSGGSLVPYFPHRDPHCQVCAHCKTKNLLANVQKDSIIIYVGDGRSDICPSQYADMVFAKDDLLKYFQDRKYTCYAYRSLKDVYDFLKKRSFV
jgi:2,3-diketo-5-methylthio-1-phosphopentane phosphatase